MLKALMLTLLVIGFASTPGEALASYTGLAAGVARAVPSELQNAYWACRYGPYGRRCSWVRPYGAYYRPYYRPYRGYGYRPYRGYGYSY